MNFSDDQSIKVGEVEVQSYLIKRGINSVRDEIIKGLKSEQKYISPKYFYNEKGSELFEEITQLDAYYPTRCEKEILSTLVRKLNIDFFELDLIEFGSGDSSKIRSIFNQIPSEILESINYYPVDISQSAIEKAVHDITADFSLNHITGIVADFMHHHDYVPRRNKRLFCFLGSTIGNFNPHEVVDFINELGAVMDVGDGLLLGVDMVKDISVIELAYNDVQGVTREFNKNILNVVNSQIQSNFNPADFRHLAFYNSEKQRVEMHLAAIQNLEIAIACTNETIYLEKGETIHTENSHKFTRNQLREIGNYGGLKIENIYSDSKDWFNLVHYVKVKA